MNNLKQPSYTLSPKDFRFFNKLIECIDNNNAISAIGTLEFLDQISKYHTTNTICFLDQDTNINTSDYLPIYDKDGVFNPEFNKPQLDIIESSPIYKRKKVPVDGVMI